MEVLMRNITSAFLVLSFIAVFGIISAFAQTNGLRVEANIPFDFTVGKKSFEAGKYKIVLNELHSSIYAVSLFDENNKWILNTTAVRNGSTNRDRSDMVFAATEGGHFLEKLRTPEMGFQFAYRKSDRLLAKAATVSVPTGSSPNF
jgi:hypothetical protein